MSIIGSFLKPFKKIVEQENKESEKRILGELCQYLMAQDNKIFALQENILNHEKKIDNHESRIKTLEEFKEELQKVG
jgi:hypothetical protein